MAPPVVVFVLALITLLSSCLVADGSIRVAVDVHVHDNLNDDFDVDATKGIPKKQKRSAISYSVVNERNETLFQGGDLAVFMGGEWCVATVPSRDSGLPSSPRNDNGNDNPTKSVVTSQPLVASHQETIHGTAPGLGRYEGIRIRWSCSLHDNERNSSTPIVTSFLNFESERAVVFDIEYPEGAENTSLVRFHQSDGDIATLATFPSFVMTESSSSSSSSPTSSSSSSSSTATSQDDEGEERTKSDPATKLRSPAAGKSSYFPPTFPSALSWEGSFVQSVRGLSVGPQGGPTVFYNASDPTLKSVVVASPFFVSLGSNVSDCQPSHRCHHFHEFTAGNNQDWTGTIPAFSPGRSGRLINIPPGSSQSILLYEGKHSGITSTIQEWGTILQTLSAGNIASNATYNLDKASAVISPPSPLPTRNSTNKVKDVTLEKIGYQTDNGAMYCFCSDSNCSQVLLEEKAYLDSIGIPIGYLSFQGAGTSSGRGKAAPWCVEKWSADGGQDPNHYPLGTDVFQQALGVPLQLYTPYFCPNTTGYFQPDTPWKSVSSNPDLPGCSGFAFETVRASDSKAFFEWFLFKGIQNGGMISFESDFMNQNANCVDDFVEIPNHGADFLEGMATAALANGVSIQWCYASPNVVLSSLDFPAVTNFRVSFDFCYGRSYAIGESSLLVWAVGAAPSKDTLWTTDNHHTETPGCDWTDDHEAVAAELHVVLALMSTGPVGISDAIGMTNATLLQRAISKDGSLLQPSKPITAVDSSFLEDSKPDGYLYGTHGLELSWIFVSFQLRKAFPVTLRDFWPLLRSDPAAATATTRLVHRAFASSPECLDGADAISSGCVTLVSLKTDGTGTGEVNGNVNLNVDFPSIFVAPPSSFEFPGSDLSPGVVTVWKECPDSGVFFLGELDKYVALSPKRFRSVACTEEGVSVTLKGSAGEVVEITLVVPHATWYEVVKENVAISDPEKLARFDYRTKKSVRNSGVTVDIITAVA